MRCSRSRQRAPCLADVVAAAYDDAEASSSCRRAHLAATDVTTAKAEVLAGMHELLNTTQAPAPRLRTPRQSAKTMPRLLTCVLVVVLALSLPQLAAGLLFDPGEESTSTAEAVAAATATTAAPARKSTPKSSTARSVKLVESKGLSALTREPISIHPSCRRMTDLFDNVCPNPWSPFLNTRDRAPRSELIVCPLSQDVSHSAQSGSGEGRRERVYAVSGTITVPEDVILIPNVSDAPSIDAIVPALVSTGELKWPQPGDEGFWRHKDGELEWVPTEPRALLDADASATTTGPQGSDDPAATVQGISADPMQAHEYDAWSASVGGEDSETWLSFETWREKHLAAEKERMEAERQRHAAERRQRSEKNREANKTQGNGSGQPGENAPAASGKGTNVTDGSDISDGVERAAKDDRNGESAHSAPSDEKAEEVAQGDAVAEKPPTREQPIETVPPPPRAQASTGIIPAISNPAQDLKDLRHRFNFASFDCAAVVHRSNPSAKFASAILSEKKDRYMLSPCPASSGEEQFVVVELCDEIVVDTLVLANFEFFSRMFKKFRVRVSRSLNSGEGEWADIGTFRARNIRGQQVFKPVNPPGDARFYRYMRIDFQEHYGNEYYCPVSLLRVYGLTQMDDYVREEEEMRKQREREIRLLNGEEEVEDEAEQDTQDSSADGTKSETVAAPAETASEQSVPSSTDPASAGASRPEFVQSIEAPVGTQLAASEEPRDGMPHPVDAAANLSNITQDFQLVDADVRKQERTGAPVVVKGERNGTSEVASQRDNTTSNSDISVAQQDMARLDSNATTPDAAEALQSDLSRSSTTMCNSPPNPTTAPPLDPSSAGHKGSQSRNSTVDSRSGVAPKSTAVAVPPANGSAEARRPAQSSADNVSVEAPSGTASGAATGSASSQYVPAASNSAQAQHQGGSESIYRAITKRLNSLEMNATLSLQYMDHSRQMLRETFQRMERNQRDKIGQMLRELNASNWRQIESLKRRQQVDLQQAIFEFDMHRQQTDAERRALLAQVHILSNEVLLEKRFGIAQLVLLLGLFVFMAFTRSLHSPPMLSQGIARLGRTTPPNASSKRKGRGERQMALASEPELYDRADVFANERKRSSDRPVSHRKSSGLARREIVSRRSHYRKPRMARSTKLGQLLVPRETTRPIAIDATSEHGYSSEREIVPKMEDLSDQDIKDVKSDISIGTYGKNGRDLLGMKHLHPQAALSRNVTLTRDNMPHSMRNADRKPSAIVKSEPNDFLRVPAADESMNSDWGTERSEDGEESDASLPRAGEPRFISPRAMKAQSDDDYDDAFEQSRHDINISPRLVKHQSPRHLSTPEQLYRLAKRAGSPLHANGHGSPVRANAGVPGHAASQPPATNLDGSRRESLGSHTMPAYPFIKHSSPQLHDESDAEEDQPPWNQVQSRRSIRRSTNGTSGSGIAEDEMVGTPGNGNSPNRTYARAPLSHVGRNGSTNGSRLHTPTGPVAPSFRAQAGQDDGLTTQSNTLADGEKDADKAQV